MGNEDRKKLAAMYIRVSTEDQSREGHSLETQLDDCKHFIQKNGWRLGRIYREVESGAKNDREQYQQLLKDADEDKFQVLVVWKLDRLTRDTIEGLRVVKHLVDDSGLGLFSVTEPLDTETAYGRKRLRDALSEAEYERERLKERVMPGMKRGVAKGNWQGSRYCFYGYRYDKGAKKLIELEDEMKIVRRIYQLRSKGLAVYSIALKLSEEGVRNRTGRYFTTRQIENILFRSLYGNGHLEWNGVTSEAAVVKPVIPGEIWEKVQQVNNERSRDSQKIRAGRVTSIYVLQGVLKCRFSNGNMVGNRLTVNRKTGARSGWYVCGERSQRTRKACKGQSVKAEVAEHLAFDILKKVMNNPQLIELTRQEIKATLEHGQPHLFKRRNQLRDDIRRLKQEQAKCLKAYYDEAITTEQLKSENSRLLKEQQEVEKELSQAEAKLHGAEQFRGKLDQVFELLRDFEAVWVKMTPVQQRVVYRGVFEYLKIEGAPRSRHFKVGDFSLKEPFKSWYDNKTWEGPLVLKNRGAVVVTSSKDRQLCKSYGFAPTGVK